MVGIINVQRGVEVQVCASSSPLLIELTKKKNLDSDTVINICHQLQMNYVTHP